MIIDKRQYLQRLRAATSRLHKSLEELTGGAELMNNPDRVQYTKLLFTHYRYHAEVARHTGIARQKEGLELLDWPNCVRKDALLEDLNSLGIDVSTQPSTMVYHSPGFAMGLCYVAEGSVMGNKMMYQKMKAYGEFESWHADQFFKTSINHLSERWQKFVKQLNQYAEMEYDDIEAGGIAGFRLFAALWLDADDEFDPFYQNNVL